MDDLSIFTNVTEFPDGTKEVKYAFGPEWVAMAMYVDDYGFNTEEEAVVSWFRSIYSGTELKDEKDALDWYTNIFKVRLKDAGSNYSAKDNSEDIESSGTGDIEKVSA